MPERKVVFVRKRLDEVKPEELGNTERIEELREKIRNDISKAFGIPKEVFNVHLGGSFEKLSDSLDGVEMDIDEPRTDVEMVIDEPRTDVEMVIDEPRTDGKMGEN